MLKYLRLAVTAFSLTACVLLMGLCVRSFTTTDILFGHISRHGDFTVDSSKGALILQVYEASGAEWETFSYVHEDKVKFERSRWRAGSTTFPVGWYVCVPHWSLMLLATLIAVVPWGRSIARLIRRGNDPNSHVS